MAIDLSKYSVGSLNRKEVLDARARDQFWPRDLSGTHKEALLGYRFDPPTKENQNKASFRVTVKVLESTAKNAVGREYTVYLRANGDPKYQYLTDNSRAGLVAASDGKTAEDPTFDLDAVEQELLDADARGDLKGGTVHILHTSVSKTKQRAVIKNGLPALEEEVNCNHYFNPVVAE